MEADTTREVVYLYYSSSESCHTLGHLSFLHGELSSRP